MDGSTCNATLLSTRCICCAYGRALVMRSCARRSFDAATIFMALVICCVFLTARIRRLRSIRDGISSRHEGTKARRHERETGLRVFVVSSLRLSRRGLSAGEIARKLLHGGIEGAFELIIELLFVDDAAKHVGIPILDERVQLGFKRPYVGDGNLVEVAVHARVEERHLAFDGQRFVLRLLQNLDEPSAAVELRLR